MTKAGAYPTCRTVLVDTPANPVPPGAELTSLTTSDGLRLRIATWRPKATARGTVVILQGRAEFIEKYFETVGALLARGLCVVAFDWRGQGGSDRKIDDPAKGHVTDFAQYRRDVEAVAEHLSATDFPRPHLGLAHSMGGCIALTGARYGWLPVERLVASAPMVDLKLVRHPRLVRTVIRAARWLGCGRRFVPGGDGRSISTLPFAGNRLSGDLDRYVRNAEAAIAIGAGAVGAPTIGWLDAAYRAMRLLRVRGYAAAIPIPVLIVAAGDDPVCSTAAIGAFSAGLSCGPAVVIPDARHEILMETDPIRERFWRLFDSFILASLAPSPSRSAGEQLQHDLVQARIAAGDDRPSPRG